MSEKKPFVTVVTICFNAEKSIRQTIESVLNQVYRPIEYIVIDGGSTDMTLSIIKSYQSKFEAAGIIYRFVSEKDKGIYDAMNKGAGLALGDWVNFMNAGDYFSSSNVLFDLFDEFYTSEVKVLYGDTIKSYSCGQFLMRVKPLKRLNRRMIFCHQSVFVCREELQKQPFDLQYPIAADFNFFYNLYKQGVKMQYKPIPVACFEAEEGISSRKSLQVKVEYAKIRGVNNTFLWRCWFVQKKIRYYIKKNMQILLPVSFKEQLRQWNYKRLSNR